MIKPDYRSAIAEAVHSIRSNPGITELTVSSMKQAAILRILDAAGWNTYDISEVEPDYAIGSSSADFALKPTNSAKQRGEEKPTALIQVKAIDEDLDNDRTHRQVINQCARSDAKISVVTNGIGWRFYLPSLTGAKQVNKFSEQDIQEDPESAIDSLHSYLSKDKINNGQAVRSAERAFRDTNSEEKMKVAILESWDQVVSRIDEGLVDLVAVAAEAKAGMKPENKLVRKVLNDNRSTLLRTGLPEKAQSRPAGRARPMSFTFDSEVHEIKSWGEMLSEVCLIMRDRHPEDFEKILDLRGRNNPHFSRNREEIVLPRAIGDTGIYASCQGTSNSITIRTRRVIEAFGYPKESLNFETK